MPNEAKQAIELIQRIIADETADLRQQVQLLQHKLGGMTQDVRDIDQTIDTQQDYVSEVEVAKLQQQLDAIKGIHRLDATPQQWTRNGSGQMVSAPEGVWEISCLACNYTTIWKEGEPNPRGCKTVRIANGDIDG